MFIFNLSKLIYQIFKSSNLSHHTDIFLKKISIIPFLNLLNSVCNQKHHEFPTFAKNQLFSGT